MSQQNVESKIRNLIKYMDEHDQPYEDMFEEIIKLVNKHHADMQAELTKEREANKKKDEALAWYADKDNWERHYGNLRSVDFDLGQKAKTILEGNEPNEG